MTITTELPENYKRLIQVSSLSEMFEAREDAGADVNLILWRRGQLSGDFQTLAGKCYNGLGSYTNLNTQGLLYQLKRLSEQPGWTASMQEAAAILREDVARVDALLAAHCPKMARNEFRIMDDRGYHDRDKKGRIVGNNKVAGYHADGGKWRLLGCYEGAGTGWIKNEDAIEGSDDRYVPRQGAQEYAFQQGDIWLHAGKDVPDCDPFIHKGRGAANGQFRIMSTSYYM